LMMNALQNTRDNLVPSKTKKWSYLICLSIPLVGFLFALWFYMRDEDDARQVAWVCAFLSVVCLVMTWLFGKLLLSGSGTSVDQIYQIKPSDIQQLGQ